MAGEDYRRIEEVNNLRAMGQDAGGGSPGYQGSGRRDRRGSGFEKILDAEKKRHRDAELISVRNTTYSRAGVPSTVVIRMKDYTFQ